ncbi:PepSY domain-containing protein [Aureimonas psammosilenae]|uniref:PepSY domain-containing protein n=1 Tax=Aureimonas psammosilenae TaxID=2495496 RepID=UPI0012606C1E|nr:PepSY domain-containing protein [Aureimonas psammosilenae]
MKNKLMIAGILALGLTSVTAPAMAQGIEIGPNGVRVIDPRDRDARDRDVRDRDVRRDDVRRDQGISQREAIRIARSEGVRDVDNVTERRRSFRVDGADRRGRDITVDIDRITGDVISVR